MPVGFCTLRCTEMKSKKNGWGRSWGKPRDLSKNFYKAIFSEKAGQNGVPYYESSASALQIAVKKLRKTRGMTQ